MLLYNIYQIIFIILQVPTHNVSFVYLLNNANKYLNKTLYFVFIRIARYNLLYKLQLLFIKTILFYITKFQIPV